MRLTTLLLPCILRGRREGLIRLNRQVGSRAWIWRNVDEKYVDAGHPAQHRSCHRRDRGRSSENDVCFRAWHEHASLPDVGTCVC